VRPSGTPSPGSNLVAPPTVRRLSASSTLEITARGRSFSDHRRPYGDDSLVVGRVRALVDASRLGVAHSGVVLGRGDGGNEAPAQRYAG
jgi:hypothetical protein